MDRNGLGMDGIHAPPTLNRSETILRFCTFPILCDCVRISLFFFLKRHDPFQKRRVLGVLSVLAQEPFTRDSDSSVKQYDVGYRDNVTRVWR